MSQIELAKKQQIARNKVIAHYGMTEVVEHEWTKIRANKQGEFDPNISYATGLLDGFYEFADAIIDRTPDDWGM